MRLVFMGTPDFAVPCLEALIDAGHEIVAVYSQPDKPVGRKQIVEPTPVKKCALSHGITVCQPKTLRTPDEIERFKSFSPQAVAVVAYGKLIPKEMLDSVSLGFVNVHGSLLPKYRGAAPIQWAVINGDKETGVTTMLLNEGMDTGDILEISKTPIGEQETAGDLFDRLSEMGAKLLVSTLEKLENGQITPVKQNESDATVAPIISKEMALLDFDRTADEIYNAVRGFYPWPIAYTMFNGKRLKIYKAARSTAFSDVAGTVHIKDNGLFVCCCDGTCIEITELQFEGGKRMSAGQAINGRLICDGQVLGG